jgi:hypothetical protein
LYGKTNWTKGIKVADISTLQYICLNEEISISIKLLEVGLKELQSLKGGNDFYFLPFQLLSSGYERLMKCIICLDSWEKNGKFPKQKELKTHDLIILKDKIINKFFSLNCEATIADYEFILKDKLLGELLKLLSEFGKYARYYNLDIVTGVETKPMDIESEWEELKMNILESDSKLWNSFCENSKNPKIDSIKILRNINSEIIKRIVIPLEFFARSLARQFTLGELGELAMQLSPAVEAFLQIKDSDLGKKEYK